jgi:hypothetical protein
LVQLSPRTVVHNNITLSHARIGYLKMIKVFFPHPFIDPGVLSHSIY